MTLEKLQKWIDENQGKHFCNCLNHEVIIIKKRHYYAGIPKYISGHNKSTKDTKFSEQHKKNLSVPHKGQIPWNKGLTKIDDERIKKYGKSISNNKDRGLKISTALIGKTKSDQHKNKISDTLIGNTPWNKGLTTKTDNRIKSGKDAPNYINGGSFEPYCYKFNNHKKEEIRRRDDYQCQYPMCLCTQLENLILYGCSLHIHHIHYDKENCDPDLISLCKKHNLIANGKRNYHEQVFMQILNKVS